MISMIIKTLQVLKERYFDPGYFNEYFALEKVVCVFERNDPHIHIKMYHPEWDGPLTAWVDENDVLHIENDRYEDITKYAEESDWTEEDVNFIKYGCIHPRKETI